MSPCCVPKMPHHSIFSCLGLPLNPALHNILRVGIPPNRALLTVRGDRHLAGHGRAKSQLEGTDRLVAAATQSKKFCMCGKVQSE